MVTQIGQQHAATGVPNEDDIIFDVAQDDRHGVDVGMQMMHIVRVGTQAG
jgi:hypothetical protein